MLLSASGLRPGACVGSHLFLLAPDQSSESFFIEEVLEGRVATMRIQRLLT